MNEKIMIPETISLYEHEEEIFRMERHLKRVYVALIMAILLLFATNTGWLIYEGLYDTVSYSQDGEGINNINTGEQGGLTYGADTQTQNTQRR